MPEMSLEVLLHLCTTFVHITNKSLNRLISPKGKKILRGLQAVALH